MTAFPRVIVGTYEEFVLGYIPQYDEGKKNKCKFLSSFASHTHQASVRCLAGHGHVMASSGADEYINIHDMVEMEVSTVINYHNSTVTCLEFTPDGSHLVTANQSGDIAIFRSSDWTLVKLWKEAHKHGNGVTSISIHPSGSLILSTGADNILRFWNLIKGRQAYATNFSKKCSGSNSLSFGMWSQDGNFYAVCIGNKVEIFKTQTAAVVYEVITKTKIACASFTKKNLFCVGTEEGLIEVHSIKEKKLLLREQAHQTRVKCMESFSITVEKNEKIINESYLVSGDSKGIIKLWHSKKKGLNCTLKMKGEVNCDCRITCLTLITSEDVKEEKQDAPESIKSTEESQNNSLKNHIAKNGSLEKNKINKRKKNIREVDSKIKRTSKKRKLQIS